MRILLVDDEKALLDQIGNTLAGQGYTVDRAETGDEALDRLFGDEYDLVVLDVMLPGRDGFEVLRIMREEKIDSPVLMLTARKEVDDRVRGLDLGADDYLKKPFSMAELLARIRAMLRRNSDNSSRYLAVGAVSLDTAAREVMVAGNPVKLTPREFSLLEFLLYNRNRAISRFSLAEHIWGDEFDPFTMSNNIDVHIRNIRRKLGNDHCSIISTVRGIGYMVRGDRA